MANKLTPQEQIEELQVQIARRSSELAAAKVVNLEASARASFFAGNTEEILSGRTVKVKKCKNPYVKKEDDQIWEEVEEPTYLMPIDMPPVGGTDIKRNGIEEYHGQVYEMTLDSVRTVKEIIYRLRAHEASIHGSDEDVFRPRVSKQISLKTGQIRNLPPNW